MRHNRVPLLGRVLLSLLAFKKQSQENERQLEDSIPKHLPLKIRLSKEKEAGFKDR